MIANNEFIDFDIADIETTAVNGFTCAVQDRGITIGSTGNTYENFKIRDLKSTYWVYGMAITGESLVTIKNADIVLVDMLIPLDRLWGVSVWGDNSGVDINNSEIKGADDGIHIRNAIDNTFSKIRNCNIEDNNDYQINHAGTNLLDAKYNWLGSPDSTIVATKINGLVTYEPFITKSNLASDVTNDSSISGAAVIDALNNLRALSGIVAPTLVTPEYTGQIYRDTVAGCQPAVYRQQKNTQTNFPLTLPVN